MYQPFHGPHHPCIGHRGKLESSITGRPPTLTVYQCRIWKNQQPPPLSIFPPLSWCCHLFLRRLFPRLTVWSGRNTKIGILRFPCWTHTGQFARSLKGCIRKTIRQMFLLLLLIIFLLLLKRRWIFIYLFVAMGRGFDNYLGHRIGKLGCGLHGRGRFPETNEICLVFSIGVVRCVGCVVRQGGGGNNLVRIKSRGGLSLSFVVVRGAAIQKSKHFWFPLWCVISCDNIILTYLFLDINKLLVILYPHQNEGIYKVCGS